MMQIEKLFYFLQRRVLKICLFERERECVCMCVFWESYLFAEDILNNCRIFLNLNVNPDFNTYTPNFQEFEARYSLRVLLISSVTNQYFCNERSRVLTVLVSVSVWNVWYLL